MTTLRLPLPLAAFHVLSDKVLFDAYDAGERQGDVLAAWFRQEGYRLTPSTDLDSLKPGSDPPAIPAGLLAAEAHHDYCGLAEEQAIQYFEGFQYALRCAVNETRED